VSKIDWSQPVLSADRSSWGLGEWQSFAEGAPTAEEAEWGIMSDINERAKAPARQPNGDLYALSFEELVLRLQDQLRYCTTGSVQEVLDDMLWRQRRSSNDPDFQEILAAVESERHGMVPWAVDPEAILEELLTWWHRRDPRNPTPDKIRAGDMGDVARALW
jgi:hypothetical protein